MSAGSEMPPGVLKDGADMPAVYYSQYGWRSACVCPLYSGGFPQVAASAVGDVGLGWGSCVCCRCGAARKKKPSGQVSGFKAEEEDVQKSKRTTG